MLTVLVPIPLICDRPIGLHLKQTHTDGPQQPNPDPTYPLFAMSDSSKVVSIMQ